MSDQNLLAQLASLLQVRQLVAPDFMSRQNVVACGVGYKIAGGKATGTPSIVVSVSRKLPVAQLTPADLIPSQVQNAPTDVIETGEIVAHGFVRTGAVRPLRPGISLGLLGGSTGTLGCFVLRNGQNYILSNNHVLAHLNQAHQGDAVIQPGTADGGTAASQVATLADFIPLTFTTAAASAPVAPQSAPATGFAALLDALLQALSGLFNQKPLAPPPPPPLNDGNRVDAALALPGPGISLDPNIVDLGAPPSGVIDPQLAMKVFKSGRSSGVTEGTVTQIDVTVNVKYGDQVARFTNQIMTTPFSQPGDSGSLVLDFQRNAVGLLFSGSDQVSVLNPINMVLAAFNAQLVTTPSTGAPAPDFG